MKKCISLLLVLVMMLAGGSIASLAEAAAVIEAPDVLVVGAGMAGLTTAIKVCEAGGKVILCEQTERVGGSSLYSSSGFIMGIDTQMQRDAGVEDSKELALADFSSYAGDRINLPLAELYCEKSGATVDWLENDLKVDFGDRVPTKGLYQDMSAARVYTPVGGAPTVDQAILAALQPYIDNGQASLLYSTLVTAINTDESGKVVGVTTEDGTVYTAPATVLCTGGYGYNEELLKKYNFTNIQSMAPKSAIGSGYVFAEELGGGFNGLDYCSNYAGGIQDTGFDFVHAAAVQYPGAIWVNPEGERVADEMTADSTVREQSWANATDNIVYVLYDEAMISGDYGVIVNVSGKPVSDDPAKLKEMLDQLIADGYAYHADSIEGLADAMGIDAAKLGATVEQYNADCEAGKDSVFGRTDSLIPFNSGSYYAIGTIPYVLMTSGGVNVNEKMQLIREDGSAIEGVYAAGELVGKNCLLGTGTLGGIGHGICLTFGTIAAESALEYVNAAK